MKIRTWDEHRKAAELSARIRHSIERLREREDELWKAEIEWLKKRARRGGKGK